MKRLFAIGLVLLLAATCVTAQTVHYRDTATLAWDAVVQTNVQVGIDGEGEPVVEEVQAIEYEVFRTPYPVADRSSGTLLGMTSLLEFDITIPDDDQAYAYGVRTVYTTVAATVVYSEINWSDQNGEWTPDPFLYARLARVLRWPPKGLSRE